MSELKIELLPPYKPVNRIKRFYTKAIKTTFYVVVFLIVGGVIFSYRIATSDVSLMKQVKGLPIISQVKHFIGFGSQKLKGETNDRINILLLGIGGAGHEGPELTDTIMIISIKPSTKQIALMSIPRDLVVPMGKFGWRKINNANAFGESIQKDFGGTFAQEIISQTFTTPIHYHIKIDFEGLINIVDILGGLKINVERNFTDYTYPTDDFYTQTVSFQEGWQVMDGETVLKYVRSRHGTNGEGSDFARAKRQRNVLTSLKNQTVTPGLLLNPSKINALLKTIEANISTDLEGWEVIRLAGIARGLRNHETILIELDDGPGGYLYSTITAEGAYVLLPKNDSFSEINWQLKYVFTPKSQQPQPITVAIRNGTYITDYASAAAKILSDHDFFTTQITNAVHRDWQKTTIYKLTGNVDQTQLDWLANIFSANVSLGLPNWLTITNAEIGTSTTVIPPSDMLIILGEETSTNIIQ